MSSSSNGNGGGNGPQASARARGSWAKLRTAFAPSVGRAQRNEEYRALKQEYHAALSKNEVGRTLLTDPHVANARLISDPTQPPVHTQTRGNPFEDTINMRGLDPFRGHERSDETVLKEHSSSYTHEAIHKFNHQTQPTVFEQRKITNGTHDAWDSAEEEFVITGRNPANPTFNYNPTMPPGHSALSENAARAEMDLPLRHSHRPVHNDLPGPMTGQEYAAFQEQRRGQEALVTDHSASAAPNPAMARRQAAMQARMQARAQARRSGSSERKSAPRKNQGNGGGGDGVV